MSLNTALIHLILTEFCKVGGTLGKKVVFDVIGS